MIPEIEEIIAQIPDWRDRKDIQIEPLPGLTNSNYAVTVDGEQFVLRISGPNADRLGINRELEYQALSAASEAEIGPEILHFVLPQGHLVTRYLEGRHLKLKEYRTEGNLQRIVKAIKILHELPPVDAIFSPFRRVEVYTDEVKSMDVCLPPDFEQLVEKMESVKREQERDTYPWRKFCHNDLFCVNVIDDGTIRFIDWEFAGMGDIYYDLATLTYAYNSPETLSPGLQAFLLECYFGEVTAQNWTRLAGMKYMVMFFSAMWSLLQCGMQKRGLVQAPEGFDFIEYANNTFGAMRITLDEKI